MEFHLPFFALRKALSLNDSHPKAHGKRLRESKDLSFLKGQNTEQEEHEQYCIYQAQVSLVVNGFDEWQWTAYAFVDTEHDDDDDSPDKSISEGLTEDPIGCGLDANLPIWRPRQYFLRAFENRVKQIRQEWNQLVRKLVLDINQYVCCFTLNFKWLLAISDSNLDTNPPNRNERIHLHGQMHLGIQKSGLKRWHSPLTGLFRLWNC
jgi:hypothetical protein